MKNKILFKYIVAFPLNALSTAFVFAIFGFCAFFLISPELINRIVEYQYFEFIIIALYILISSYLTYYTIVFQYERKARLADKNANMWKASILEQSSGYPSLMNAINVYEKLKDQELSNTLITKKHPAPKAADVVRKETKKRRKAELENRKTKALLEYYEQIAPFLQDFKDEIIETNKDDSLLDDYSKEERSDPTTNFLTKQEYRKLSTSRKNQLALDRFWQRPKSKRLIGRLYERYVGYLYENEGYDVEYVGIFKGYEDLGRDLICRKGDEVLIVQCNNELYKQVISIINQLPKRQTQSEINSDLFWLLTNKGWNYDTVPQGTGDTPPIELNVAVSLDNVRNGSECRLCLTSTTLETRWHSDFVKVFESKLVQIEAHFGKVEAMFKDFCGFRIAYAERRLALGIEIVLCNPTSYFAHRRNAIGGMASFDIAKNTLNTIGLNCPIWLVGIN